MKTSEAGVTLIKAWESRTLTAYLCPAGDPTIGYGHTDGVKMGDRITAYQADQFLRDDLAIAESAIERNVTAPITGTQHAALVSWAFNVGSGAVAKSTLVRLLNQDRYDEVPGQLLRWIKVTDPVTKRKSDSNGLRNRRKAEIALWLTDDTTTPMETPVPASRPVSPDRSSPAKSQTIQAVSVGMLTAGGGVLNAALSANWINLAIIVALIAVLAVIFRLRLRDWAAGWR
jgi:lysozyme